jgi:hypothetical protein
MDKFGIGQALGRIEHKIDMLSTVVPTTTKATWNDAYQCVLAIAILLVVLMTGQVPAALVSLLSGGK